MFICVHCIMWQNKTNGKRLDSSYVTRTRLHAAMRGCDWGQKYREKINKMKSNKTNQNHSDTRRQSLSMQFLLSLRAVETGFSVRQTQLAPKIEISKNRKIKKSRSRVNLLTEQLAAQSALWS